MRTSIYSGDTLDLSTSAVAEDGWSVTFFLFGEDLSRPGDEASYSDGAWRVSIGADDTADLCPGTYGWRARATSSTGLVRTVAEGKVIVKDGSAFDVEKTFAERCLEKVEALLLDASESADLSISVGDSDFSFENRADLMGFRRRLRREVHRERHGFQRTVALV